MRSPHRPRRRLLFLALALAPFFWERGVAQIEFAYDNFTSGTVRPPPNPSNVSATLNAYQVGNSLSEDAGSPTTVQTAIALDSGFALATNYHIWDGHSLEQIVATPSTFSEVFPSQWDTALPASKRQLFPFQPSNVVPATIGGETAAFQTLAAAALSGPSSPGARFFLYETWPDTTKYSVYATYWNGAIVDADATPFTLQLAAMNAMYQRLQASALGAANVWVVPVGSVFALLDLAARAGAIAGATQVQDFYRDATHMGQAGRLIAAAAFFSTFYRRPASPGASTLALCQGFDNGASTVTLTQSLATELAGLAWSAVSVDARAMH